jgi:sulfur carrier protein
MGIGLRVGFEAAMDVVLNGKAIETAARVLSELVAEHALGGAKVATALNGNFVAEASRSATPLQPGDRIEIVSPRQGG